MRDASNETKFLIDFFFLFLFRNRCLWTIGYCTYRIITREISMRFGGILSNTVSKSTNTLWKVATSVTVTTNRLITSKFPIAPFQVLFFKKKCIKIPHFSNKFLMKKNLPFLLHPLNRSSNNSFSYVWLAKRQLKHWYVICYYPVTVFHGHIYHQCDIQCGVNWPLDHQWHQLYHHFHHTIQHQPIQWNNRIVFQCHPLIIILPHKIIHHPLPII